jgi:hypothetical protein
MARCFYFDMADAKVVVYLVANTADYAGFADSANL